jgi:hypothetical protein
VHIVMSERESMAVPRGGPGKGDCERLELVSRELNEVVAEFSV